MKIKGGMFTALVTPFYKSGEVDFESLKRLVEDQIDKGVDGFVVAGTTGESPNLSFQEIEQVFISVKENSPKNTPIILGVGTNSTSGTIARVQSFEHLNADAYLVVTPYYNKPTQQGLVAHFSHIAAATEKDIILYDVPGRTIVEMDSDTVAELAKIPNIIGIKDATGRIEKLKEMQSKVEGNFVYLSGDDGTTCEFIKEGGHGVISVLSHVVPAEFKAAMQGEVDFAKYANLCDLLFCEPNPTPVKFALNKMKILETPLLRLPLLELSSESAPLLEDEMKKVGVL